MVPSEAALARIAAGASSLAERLHGVAYLPSTSDASIREAGEVLERWRAVVGQGFGAALEKRLAWDGRTLQDVSPVLGEVVLREGEPLPSWTETLRAILRAPDAEPPPALPSHSTSPVPFEEALAGAVSVGRERLVAALGRDPHTRLSPAAYGALERSLLLHLAKLAEKALYLELDRTRPFGAKVLGGSSCYLDFVGSVGIELFERYPVLARLLSRSVELWAETSAELIDRLEKDRDALEERFGAACDTVVELTPYLSDAHRGARSVAALTFESGLRLVYKPKDLALDLAFKRLIEWMNGFGAETPLLPMKVLNRGTHGWVEHVDQAPCRSVEEARRFYRRAGALVATAYLLGTSDGHFENVIACGEHPHLVDLETLIGARARPLDAGEPAREDVNPLEDSVLTSGLLPAWEFRPEDRVAFDISGLGCVEPLRLPKRLLRWTDVNTDRMQPSFERVLQGNSRQKNAPALLDTTLCPNDYLDDLIAGFEAAYRLFVERRGELLAPEGPLSGFRKAPFRFVVRTTEIYGVLIQRSLGPEVLQNGARRSVELEALAPAFLLSPDRPAAWPVLEAELEGVERLDVPYFSGRADSDALVLDGGRTQPRYFAAPSIEDLDARLARLGERDLAFQSALVRGAFETRGPTRVEPSTDPQEDTSFLDAARAIAKELVRRAIPGRDGDLGWLGLGLGEGARSSQLQLLGPDLYDGLSGVMLFLAAHDRVTGEDTHRAVLEGAWRAVERGLEARSDLGIGAGTGLGSIVYGMARVGSLLDDTRFVERAARVAARITPERTRADRRLDVMSGSAGAILGLLSLHAVTRDRALLKTAVACGEHLLARGAAAGSPLTAGFSHGAAGIAHALQRLSVAAEREDFLEASREAMTSERAARSTPTAAARETSWCNGATGYGLMLAAAARSADEDGSGERDVESAINAVRGDAGDGVVYLCCGAFGHVELLRFAAPTFSRPEWLSEANALASRLQARAHTAGGHRLFHELPVQVFNPGLFRGVAGIGYTLLQLASGGALPCVLLFE